MTTGEKSGPVLMMLPFETTPFEFFHSANDRRCLDETDKPSSGILKVQNDAPRER
jgi:hypothetical protein